jgi:hypothetical protein
MLPTSLKSPLLVSLLLAWALAAAAGSLPLAAKQVIQSTGAGGALVLTPGASGRALLVSTHERSGLELELPEGAALDRIEPLAGGWVAAGRRRGPGGQGLLLIAETGDGPEELPAPPTARPAVGRPSPLISRGRLAGLAWLEGEDDESLAVMASAAGEGGWQAPVTVAAADAGPQVALSAAVLADGSWMLVWAAFDGEDTELVWSRREPGGEWSPVRPIDAEDNTVPDIAPSLVAAGDGALVAWSRYTDRVGYRLHLARFGDGAWSLLPAPETDGSLWPEWTSDGGSLRLLYRTPAPGSWRLAELDSSGRVLRRARAATDNRERPAVFFERGAARLYWPAEGEERAARWKRVP